MDSSGLLISCPLGDGCRTPVPGSGGPSGGSGGCADCMETVNEGYDTPGGPAPPQPKTGKDLLPDVVNRVKELLTPDCAEKEFGVDKDTALKAFNLMIEGGRADNAAKSKTIKINAIVFKNMALGDGAANTVRNLSGIQVAVNTTQVDPAKAVLWNQGNAEYNEMFLIHELGHVLKFLGYKGGEFIQNDDKKVGKIRTVSYGLVALSW